MEELKYPEYIDDIKRIMKVCIDYGYYTLTLKQAEDAWLDYSEGMAAVWMSLGNDEEIWYDIQYYIEGIIS